MNATMIKGERSKLLVAVAVLAMMVCAFAVAMPSVDATDGNNQYLTAADEYTYTGDSEYTYVGDRTVSGDSVLMVYGSAYNAEMAEAVMDDFARYMGAIYRANGDAITSVTYDGVEYTWNSVGTLKGSNWVDSESNTLVSAVTADVAAEFLSSAQDGGSIVLTLGVSGGDSVGITYGIAPAVAYIEDTYYGTLQAAVDAAADNNTITLYEGAATDEVIQGNGVKFSKNTTITIDFNGLTYDVNPETVGSSGTETNGFQLLKGNTVTLKNGTIISTVNDARILLQNYCDLTIDDFTVDASSNNEIEYGISNNNDSLTLKGGSNIFMSTGQVAFDLYNWTKNGYEDVTVTIDESFTGVIDGKVELTTDGQENNYVNTLNINADVTISSIDVQYGIVNIAENVTVISGNISVAQDGTLNNSGTIAITNGGTFSGTITSGADSSTATITGLKAAGNGIEFTAGSVIITGTIDATDAVSINADGKLVISGEIVNESTTAGGLTITVTDDGDEVYFEDLTVAEGAELNIDENANVIIPEGKTLENKGTVNIAGNINVAGNASISVAEGATLSIASTGTMTVTSNGSVSGNGKVVNDGTINGTVETDDYTNNGVVLSDDGTVANVETIGAFYSALDIGSVKTIVLNASLDLTKHVNTNGKAIDLNGNDLTTGTWSLNVYTAGAEAINVPENSTFSFSGIVKMTRDGMKTAAGAIIDYDGSNAAFYNYGGSESTGEEFAQSKFIPRFVDGTIVVMEGYSYTTTTITTSNGATIMIGVNGVAYNGTDYAGPNGTVVATVIESWPESATITPFSEQYKIYQYKDNADKGNDVYGTVKNAGTYYIRMGFSVNVGGNLATPYVVAQFVITPMNIKDCTIENIEDQIYNGSPIEPGVTITNGETQLVQGVDYTLSYSNNINEGTATVTITGIGNYTGTIEKQFQIADVQGYIDNLTDWIDSQGLGKEVPGAEPTTYAQIPDIYKAINSAYDSIYNASDAQGRQTALDNGKAGILAAVKNTLNSETDDPSTQGFLQTVYNYSEELSGPDGYLGLYMSTALYNETATAISNATEPIDAINAYENALANRTALPLEDLYADLEDWIGGSEGLGSIVPGSEMKYVEVPQIAETVYVAYYDLANAQTITGATNTLNDDKTEILLQTKDYVRFLLGVMYNDGNGYMGWMMSEETYNEALQQISPEGSRYTPSDVIGVIPWAMDQREPMSTVTFYVNGSVYATIGFVGENVDISGKVDNIKDPVVAGMQFVAWTLEDGVTIPDFSSVTGDLSVYAQFSIDGSLFGDNFSFGYMFSDEYADPYNSTLPWFVVNYQRVYDGTTVTIEVDGVEFGTFTGDSNYAAYWLIQIGIGDGQISPGQHKVTLTATLGGVNEIRTFTVNVIDYVQVLFQDENGNNIDVQYPVNGTAITLPKIADIEGMEFVGWSVDGIVVGQPGDLYTVNGDTILTALYEEVSMSEPTVTIEGIPNSFVTGQEYVFTVSTTAGDMLGTRVLGTGSFTAPEGSYTVWYLENNPENVNYGKWLELPGIIFGDPSTGFDLIDTTSYFKVVFSEAGNWDLTVKMVDFDDQTNVLCEDSAKVIVLEASDLPELDTREPRQPTDYYSVMETVDGVQHIYILTDKYDTSVYKNVMSETKVTVRIGLGEPDVYRLYMGEVGMYDDNTLIVADYIIDKPNGAAMITVQGWYADEWLDYGSYRVYVATGITVDPTEINMTVGDVSTITATVTPDTAIDKTVTWTVDGEGIILTDNGDGTATVTATSYTAVGEVVTITATNASGNTATVIVTVKEIVGIEVTSPTKTMYYVGETLDTEGMVVMATYSDGTSVDVTADAVVDTVVLNVPGNPVVVGVTYGVFEGSFDVVVGAVNGFTVKLPDPLYAGTTLTVDNLNMIVNYTNGLDSRPAVADNVVFEPTTVQMGDESITITYTEGGFTSTQTFEIVVVEPVTEPTE